MKGRNWKMMPGRQAAKYTSCRKKISSKSTSCTIHVSQLIICIFTMKTLLLIPVQTIQSHNGFVEQQLLRWNSFLFACFLLFLFFYSEWNAFATSQFLLLICSYLTLINCIMYPTLAFINYIVCPLWVLSSPCLQVFTLC